MMRDDEMRRPHPIQPLELNANGVLRFKANAIVQHLLDNGGIDMNALARLPFSREDREQFAQLIGYSHSGSGDLGYVSDEVWEAALAVYDGGATEAEARRDAALGRLEQVTESARNLAAALFNVHADDLELRP